MQEQQTRHSQVTTQTTSYPTETEHPQKTYSQKKALFRINQVIWYALGLLETLLLARFVLRALGANPASGFVNFIYSLSAPFVAPFRGIFPTPQTDGLVVEWFTLIALIAYLLLAYAVVYLLQLLKPTNPAEVEQELS
jgi:uncharacterized protein YggT (Ycf19 family)